MTKDELLAGFLDRSLSEDQMLEFQARRSADPEFAARGQQHAPHGERACEARTSCCPSR